MVNLCQLTRISTGIHLSERGLDRSPSVFPRKKKIRATLGSRSVKSTLCISYITILLSRKNTRGVTQSSSRASHEQLPFPSLSYSSLNHPRSCPLRNPFSKVGVKSGRQELREKGDYERLSARKERERERETAVEKERSVGERAGEVAATIWQDSRFRILQ